MAELTSAPAKQGRKGSLHKTPPRVDLTAMVDLAFLLITFFMLTTSLAKHSVMPLAVPDESNHPEPIAETRTMTICLGKNDKALWYMGMADKPLSTPALINYGADLNQAIANSKKMLSSTGKDLIVLIKPAQHSVYANLVDVLDQMNIQNVQSYAISPMLPKDIEFLKQKNIY